MKETPKTIVTLFYSGGTNVVVSTTDSVDIVRAKIKDAQFAAKEFELNAIAQNEQVKTELGVFTTQQLLFYIMQEPIIMKQSDLVIAPAGSIPRAQ